MLNAAVSRLFKLKFPESCCLNGIALDGSELCQCRGVGLRTGMLVLGDDDLGSLLGGRDHSTIIHGINKIGEEYDNNPQTKSLIDTIKKKINPN